jgi:hypothetical protein
MKHQADTSAQEKIAQSIALLQQEHRNTRRWLKLAILVLIVLISLQLLILFHPHLTFLGAGV